VNLNRHDLETCRVGLLWIRRHRQLFNQPPHPAIERAFEHLEEALATSSSGPEDEAEEQNWITTKEAAELLGCSTRHARRIARRTGCRKDGRDWLIPKGAL
jgi:excisionase family DNA binding protein